MNTSVHQVATHEDTSFDEYVELDVDEGEYAKVDEYCDVHVGVEMCKCVGVDVGVDECMHVNKEMYLGVHAYENDGVQLAFYAHVDVDVHAHVDIVVVGDKAAKGDPSVSVDVHADVHSYACDARKKRWGEKGGTG